MHLTLSKSVITTTLSICSRSRSQQYGEKIRMAELPLRIFRNALSPFSKAGYDDVAKCYILYRQAARENPQYAFHNT